MCATIRRNGVALPAALSSFAPRNKKCGVPDSKPESAYSKQIGRTRKKKKKSNKRQKTKRRIWHEGPPFLVFTRKQPRGRYTSPLSFSLLDKECLHSSTRRTWRSVFTESPGRSRLSPRTLTRVPIKSKSLRTIRNTLARILRGRYSAFPACRTHRYRVWREEKRE